ncbi:MAG: hypothetical protein RML38_03530 [Bacteroidia bacterium]|nr:hypothetical protein [Bacteroidia bacterium]
MKRRLFWSGVICTAGLLSALWAHKYLNTQKSIRENLPTQKLQSTYQEKSSINSIKSFASSKKEPSLIITAKSNPKKNISIPKATFVAKNQHKTISKEPIAKTEVNRDEKKAEKAEEVKEEFTVQPLYHLKEKKEDTKKDIQKPEPIYHEQKLFDYKHPLKQYFEQYTAHSEYLWVDDDKDYIHTTSNHSKIKLHNTIFVDKYGKRIEGEAVLEFKELSHGTDFIKANVSTNVQDELKYAHQIWYVAAKQKNNPIFLGPNTVITIQTISEQPLHFYIGKHSFNGEIEWKPIPEQQIKKVALPTHKKKEKKYEYYCNLSELGWVAAFYEPKKQAKTISVNIKEPFDLPINQVMVCYIDEKTNYLFRNTNSFSVVTPKRTQLMKKIKKYAQGNIFEGKVPPSSKEGKIIAMAYYKGNYYFAQTDNIHKEQIDLKLLPTTENEINQYLCKD